MEEIEAIKLLKIATSVEVAELTHKSMVSTIRQLNNLAKAGLIDIIELHQPKSRRIYIEKEFNKKFFEGET